MSFLMNLTANSGVLGAADASSLPVDAPDADMVNAFFTIHAGLAAGDKSVDVRSFAAIKENSPAENFFHHFDAAGTGFDINRVKEFFITPAAMAVEGAHAVETSFAPEAELDLNAAKELFGGPEIEGANETLAAFANSDQPDFKQKLRSTDISGAEIERINRLDMPNNSDENRHLARPDVSVGLPIAKQTTPVIAQDARNEPDRGANRELPAFVDEARNLGVFKNPEARASITIDPQEFSAIPSAADKVSIENNTQKESAFPAGQKPALNIGQTSAFIDVKAFDIAAFAAANRVRVGDIREQAGDIAIRENAPEIGASAGTHKAAAVTAPISGAGITAQPVAAKLSNPLLTDAVLPASDGDDISIDETMSEIKRFGLGSEAGRTAIVTTLQAPTTMPAFVASAVAAERILAEENVSAPVIEPGAISTVNSSGERAPIQFASPATPPPAGAAWAQVISAISERSGEAKLELRLNPPELGRVIIGFESDGADLVRAVVSADSQQTLDLMRRNLDILQRELARSGLDNINVEIADRDSNAHAQDADEQLVAYAAKDEAPAYINNNIPLTPFVADGRLDLRV